MTTVRLFNTPRGVAVAVNGMVFCVHRVTPEHPLNLEVARVGDELRLHVTGVCSPIIIHDFSHAKTTDCGAPPTPP